MYHISNNKLPGMQRRKTQYNKHKSQATETAFEMTQDIISRKGYFKNARSVLHRNTKKDWTHYVDTQIT